MKSISWSVASLLLLCSLIQSIPFNNDETLCDGKNFHTLETPESARNNCGPAFKGLCSCKVACYDGHLRHVTNCTSANFNDTEPLKNLPKNTEVLIFTGNNLKSLPWNVFGILSAMDNLNVIDMSSNKIREIHGKAFHRVPNVTRLILDFNQLSLDSQADHPRVFSNLVSLLELHLTDAFEDDPLRDSASRPTDLAATLHDIFINSNLSQLVKLHLEQNEISEFRDASVFCGLPKLMDLHLGDNVLATLNFNLSCMHALRFVDLQRNNFTRLLDRDMRTLDEFPKRNQSMMIDVLNNPFECSCKLNPFIEWMKETKVTVRNKHVMQCRKHGKKEDFHETKNCVSRLTASNSQRGTTAAITVLSLLLVALVCALVYVQREDLRKKLGPVIESVNRRVRYTSIATGETRENEA